jgi:acetyl esterase
VTSAASSPKKPVRLDRGLDAFLDRLLAGNPLPPDPSPAAIDDMRRAAARVRLSWAEGIPACEVRHDVIEAVPVTVHLPTERAPGGTLVFMHGGGWTVLDSSSYAPLLSVLVAATGWAVVGVDYPRAPENPYPGPVEACRDVVRAVRDRGASLGGPLAVAGDSAGANLALASTLMLRDAGEVLPAALLLFYGVFDCEMSRPSYAAFGSEFFPLSTEKMAWFWDRYCPDHARRREPLASPLRADLTGLPPVRIVAAGQDILRDENLAMAVRLAEAGVVVSLDVYPGAVHAFCEALAFAGVSRQAVGRAGSWLLETAHAGEEGT